MRCPTTRLVLAGVLLLSVAGCLATPGDSSSPPSTSSTAPLSAAISSPDPLGRVACQAFAEPDPAQPVIRDARPAVAATLELFATTPVVGVGEHHGWPAMHEFLGQLICDPAFPSTVDAIVVEFANSRLQDVLDRYIAGQQIAFDEIADVWRETTQTSGVWEHPVYQRFFSLVRTVNQSLPVDQRIRVLAGDPPVEMANVTDYGECNSDAPTCLDYWLYQRDESFVEVVMSEVLAKGDTALLIAGAGHMTHQLDAEIPVLNIPDLLEAAHPGSLFTMIPHRGFEISPADSDLEQRLESWPVPGLAVLDESWLGDLDACVVEGKESPDAPPCPDGKGPRLTDLADGYLYLGNQ